MAFKEQPKPLWWEIDGKPRGKTLINKEDLWKCEYYLIVQNNHTIFNVRHFEYVNSYITDLINSGADFYWMSCGNKKYAYDIKEMMQARYKGNTDREHQKGVKKWK